MLKKELEKNPSTRTVVLLVTNNCNLQCTYCYETNKKNCRMPLAEMKRIAEHELMADNEFAQINFNIMGGEPFLEFPAILSLTEFLSTRDWGKEWYLSICTNGTLVHGELQEYLLKYKEKIALSLSYDGTSKMQNTNRFSSAKLIDLDFFAKHFPFVKMTISAQTLPYVAEGVIDLQQRGFLVAANLALGIDWTKDESIEIFSRELLKLSDYYIAHPKVRPCSLLDMGIETLNPLQTEIKKYCGAGSKMICYNADGKKYPCHMFAPLSIGTAKASQACTLTFDEAIDRNLLNSECQTCPVIQLCPTCEGMNFAARDSCHARDMIYCKLIKTQLLANSAFKYRQYCAGYLKLTQEEEYRLLNNIRIVQSLKV